MQYQREINVKCVKQILSTGVQIRYCFVCPKWRKYRLEHKQWGSELSFTSLSSRAQELRLKLHIVLLNSDYTLDTCVRQRLRLSPSSSPTPTPPPRPERKRRKTAAWRCIMQHPCHAFPILFIVNKSNKKQSAYFISTTQLGTQCWYLGALVSQAAVLYI